MTHEVMVGRQPIYDSRMVVRAYELLFRDDAVNRAAVTNGDQATARVLYNTFVEIGVDTIVGKNKAFVNLTLPFLLGEYPLPASPGNLVLEILEDIQPSESLMESLRELKRQGYTIALDDFVYSPHLEPLVELAQIIKIDITLLDQDQLAEHVRHLKRPGKFLLAEKVETHEEFAYCQSLGFNLYQGYFFCRPNIVKRKQMPANQLAMLQLMNALQDEDIDARELERLISQDVTLSYRLLRLVNSAYFNLNNKVESVQRALMLLGLDAVRNWSSLLALSSVDDKPLELVRTASIRARMCENLGPDIDGGLSKGAYFTVGLFSTLDALLDQPIEEVLAELPLQPGITAAIVDQEGTAGTVLKATLAYEQGDWETLKGLETGLPASTVRDHYLEALAWSDSMIAEVLRE
ncbi:MAG: EAL and HDOD domain-containing protein [Pseudomonadota bacterium]